MECFRCKAKNANLIEVISREGIVHVCKDCLKEENFPVIKKKNIDINNIMSKRIYNPKKTNRKEKNLELEKQNSFLKQISDKKYNSSQFLKKKPSELIDNFHWIIMRTRRLKHLTQAQLAKAIAEPEEMIKAAEKGILPKDNSRIINKLEDYLGIKIVKEKKSPKSLASKKQETAMLKKERPKIISFDPIITKKLTISDLRKMKNKQESDILNHSSNLSQIKEIKRRRKNGILIGSKIKKKQNKHDLSQEEIDEMIFGKK